MAISRDYTVTLKVKCRPQLIEDLIAEFYKTAHYENAEVLTSSVKETETTYR